MFSKKETRGRSQKNKINIKTIYKQQGTYNNLTPHTRMCNWCSSEGRPPQVPKEAAKEKQTNASIIEQGLRYTWKIAVGIKASVKPP